MGDKQYGSRRELTEEASGEKRLVRRDDAGHFTKNQVDVGRSLAAVRREHAKHDVEPGNRGARQQ